MIECHQKDCTHFTLCTVDHCKKSTRDALECLRTGKFYTTVPTAPAPDPVSHPSHYTSRVPGIECIQVTEWFNFARGNAIKYIWRAGEKNPEKEIEDLEKAAWYINREIQRMKGEKTK